MEIFTIWLLRKGKTSTLPYCQHTVFEEPEVEVQFVESYLYQQHPHAIALRVFIQRLNDKGEW